MFGSGGSSAGKIEVSITAKYDGSDFKRLDSDLNRAERSTRDLTTDMNRLDRATDKASRTSGTFGTAAAGIGKTLKGAAVAAAGAAAAYLSIDQARIAIETTTDLAKTTMFLSRTFGMSTDSASAFAAVAKSRNVEFTTLAMSFKSLAANIEKAKQGSATSVDAFKALGISGKQLKGLNMDQAIMAVADGFGKLEGSSQKGAIFATLLGRGYQKLSPLLRDGSKALQEQLDLARKYGATFDGNGLKGMENFIKAQREMKLAQMGLQMTFTQSVAPALIVVMKAFADLALQFKNGTGFGGELKQMFQDYGSVLQDIAPLFIFLAKALGKVLSWFVALPDPIKAVFNPLYAIKLIITGVVGAFNWLKEKVPAALSTVGKFVSGLWGKVKNAFGNIRDFVVNAAKKGFLGPIPWIISHWNGLMSFVRSIPGKVKSGLARVAGIITSPFRSAVNIVKGVIGSIPGILSSGISAAKGVINGVIGGVNRLIGAFNKLPGGDIDPITPLAEGGKVSRAQLFIAGEGNKPEWVISQEGDRKRNQGYVMEAARALGIPMFANGGRVQDGEIQLAKAELTTTLQDDLAAAKNLEKVYADSVSFFEGSKSPIKSLGQQQTNLQKALSKAKGAENKKKIKKQLKAVSEKLDSKKSEYLSDLGSLKQYRDMVTDLTAEITGGGNTAGGGSSASEQLVAFNEERLSLLSSFGGNFARRAGPMAPSSSSTTQGSTSSSKTSVTVNQTYTEPPKDAHSWTRNIQNEIAALI